MANAINQTKDKRHFIKTIINGFLKEDTEVNGLYLYSTFLVLMTTRSALQYRFIHPFTPIHILYLCVALSLLHTGRGKFGFRSMPKDNLAWLEDTLPPEPQLPRR